MNGYTIAVAPKPAAIWLTPETCRIKVAVATLSHNHTSNNRNGKYNGMQLRRGRDSSNAFGPDCLSHWTHITSEAVMIAAKSTPPRRADMLAKPIP